MSTWYEFESEIQNFDETFNFFNIIVDVTNLKYTIAYLENIKFTTYSYSFEVGRRGT